MALCMMGAISSLYAQTDKGTLMGSLESNNIYYVKDSKLGTGSVNPDDHFGSNSYLKLDYMRGKFSAGVQLEGFLPALQGYDYATYGNGKRALLGSKYVSWQDEDFGFRVGDIFEQYGSGLVFRGYKGRALGLDNSVEGVQGRYNYKGYVGISALYGRPRLYLDYANSSVRGADLNVSLWPMQLIWVWSCQKLVNVQALEPMVRWCWILCGLGCWWWWCVCVCVCVCVCGWVVAVWWVGGGGGGGGWWWWMLCVGGRWLVVGWVTVAWVGGGGGGGGGVGAQ